MLFSAQYGARTTFASVLSEIGAVKTLGDEIKVTNDNMGGDPLVGVRKVLTVFGVMGSEVSRTFDAPPSTGAPPTDGPPTGGPPTGGPPTGGPPTGGPPTGTALPQLPSTRELLGSTVEASTPDFLLATAIKSITRTDGASGEQTDVTGDFVNLVLGGNTLDVTSAFGESPADGTTVTITCVPGVVQSGSALERQKLVFTRGDGDNDLAPVEAGWEPDAGLTDIPPSVPTGEIFALLSAQYGANGVVANVLPTIGRVQMVGDELRASNATMGGDPIGGIRKALNAFGTIGTAQVFTFNLDNFGNIVGSTMIPGARALLPSIPAEVPDYQVGVVVVAARVVPPSGGFVDVAGDLPTAYVQDSQLDITPVLSQQEPGSTMSVFVVPGVLHAAHVRENNRMTFEYGSETDEFTPVTFGWEVPAGLPLPPSLPESPVLGVAVARYGARTTFEDVRDDIGAFRELGTSIKVTNRSMGGDPLRGVRKALSVFGVRGTLFTRVLSLQTTTLLDTPAVLANQAGSPIDPSVPLFQHATVIVAVRRFFPASSQWVDVTADAPALLVRDQTASLASLLTDGAGGTLEVSVIAGVMLTNVSLERQDMDFVVGDGDEDFQPVSPGWEADAGLSLPVSLPLGTVVALLSAQYGARSTFANAIPAVGVMQSVGTQIRVTNKTMGGDPLVGVRKTLSAFAVEGKINTQEFTSANMAFPSTTELAGSDLPAGTPEHQLGTVIIRALLNTGSPDGPVDVSDQLPGFVVRDLPLSLENVLGSAPSGSTLEISSVSGVIVGGSALERQTLELRVGDGQNNLQPVQAGWEAVADLDIPPSVPTGEHVALLSAVYGADTTFVDVRDSIGLRVPVGTQVPVKNNNLGGDPLPGKRKALVVFGVIGDTVKTEFTRGGGSTEPPTGGPPTGGPPTGGPPTGGPPTGGPPTGGPTGGGAGEPSTALLPDPRSLAGAAVAASTSDELLATIVLSATVTSGSQVTDVSHLVPQIILGGQTTDVTAAFEGVTDVDAELDIVTISGLVHTDAAFERETITLRPGAGENDLRPVTAGWQVEAGLSS